MDLLTRSEELLLLTVWRLREDAYGAAIRDRVTRKTGKEWSIGSVYGPLDRLARKRLLTTHVGAPTPERGGRSKRCYKLTSEGIRALNYTKQVTETFWKDLPNAILT